MTITAYEAAKLAESALSGGVSEIIAEIDAQIQAAARRGQRYLIDPHCGLETVEDVSHPQLEALKRHYEKNGFTWENLRQLDHGVPCGNPYIKLSW